MAAAIRLVRRITSPVLSLAGRLAGVGPGATRNSGTEFCPACQPKRDGVTPKCLRNAAMKALVLE
jgi:hypothetical protein